MLGLRGTIRLLLLLPWPLLYVGYWSQLNVVGPDSEGFGAGGYASGILAAAYGLTMVALNRAVVYSRHVPDPTLADLALRVVAIALYGVGTLALIFAVFFFVLGFPYSLPGALASVLALSRWRAPQRLQR